MTSVAFLSDAFAKHHRYGLSRYAWELFEAIRAHHGEIQLIPCSTKCEWSEQERSENQARYGYKHLDWDRKVLALLWSTVRVPRVESWVLNADVVHSVELSYPVATAKPWIATIHDLGPITHPEYFSSSRPWLLRKAMEQVKRKCACVVAVSQATAAAIEDVVGPSIRERIIVIPEGVHERFFHTTDRACLASLSNLPPPSTPYLLWTGSLNPRKNLGNVISAFNWAADSIPHHLVLAGGIGWAAGENLESIEYSPYRDRIHRPGYVSDDQLLALYQGADAFIYVSLMEGFGLPILEAMANGCPVITSDISSMPEVGGDAAIFVDPLDPNDIAHGIARAITSGPERDRMIENGRRRARQFAWPASAQALVNVYKNC